MKRNSKQFLALFLAAAMSVTPVSYIHAEDAPVTASDGTEEALKAEEAVDPETDEAGKKEEVTEETPGQQGDQAEPDTAEVPAVEEKSEEGKEQTEVTPTEEVETPKASDASSEAMAESQETNGVTSGYAMFKIKSSKVETEGDKLKVTIETESKTYSKIYIGSKSDPDETKNEKAVQGTETETGYLFTFELPKESAGSQVAFVPGKSDNTWYTKKDCFLTISQPSQSGGEETGKPGETEQPGETKPGTGSGEEEKPGTDDKKIADEGKYTVDVSSSAAMFRVVNCVLTSAGGKMWAEITLSGTGYDYLYVGTTENAEKASADQLIPYVVNAEGKYVYTVPVESMDTPIAIVAHSIKNDKWYDRQLTFKTEGMNRYVQVADGDYQVNVSSDSKMFKVTDCILTSKNGEMYAKLTLSGTGYDYLYAGTSAEALLADSSKWIHYVEENGAYTYTIPVSLLDTGISVAAHSIKNNKWYDRILTFASSDMKKLDNNGSQSGNNGGSGNNQNGNNGQNGGTAGNGSSSGNTGSNQKPDSESRHESDLSGGTSQVNSSTTLADGVYTPDKFSWSGGTGKVSISCTKITVTGGQAYATLVFSSGSYGYVKANGNMYYPTQTGSTSTFVIPVELNKNNTIIGMTTKMSTAHEITYSIFIYLSAAAKADGKTVSAVTNLSENKLDEKAPEIMGLSYQSETKVEHSEYFKLYHYDQGITLLEIDQSRKSDSKEEQDAKAEEKSNSGLTPAQEEQLALYKAKIVRYLIVPEKAEIPAGLDKEMIVIRQPKKSAYVASEEVLEILDKLQVTDQIGTVGIKKKDCKVESIVKAMEEKKITYAGTYKKPQNKELMKSKCDLAILSNKILPDEKNDKKLSVKEQQKRYEELAEKFVLLDLPMIVDRSADEEKDEAKAEWSKVYEAVFGVSDSAETSNQTAGK